MSAGGTLSTVKRRLLGVSLVMSIVAFLGLTVAMYQKVFKPVVPVTLTAESVGNQLEPTSDVKLHGVIVGEVREVRATEQGARLKLALDPDAVDQIPANVKARLLPKTLFGERYVALQVPKDPAAEHITEGELIRQDQSKPAIELQKVLSHTLDTLEAVQPADLAATLNALSTALNGRGEDLGRMLSQLNTYLEGINPSLGDLEKNLEELVGVANTYNEAAPDVIKALRNFTKTAQTLVEQNKDLKALTSTVTRMSNDTRKFFAANRENLIRLNESIRPVMDVLAKYAPAYPCFLEGMAGLVERGNKAFGVGTNEPGLHITLEISSNRGKYKPKVDEPAYNDKRGPRCYEVHPELRPAPQYPPDGPIKDGSTHPAPARSSNSGLNPPSEDGASPASTSPQAAFGGTGLGLANSAMEQDFIAALLAPALGVRPSEVPAWSSLLVGPILRGAEVSYR